MKTNYKNGIPINQSLADLFEIILIKEFNCSISTSHMEAQWIDLLSTDSEKDQNLFGYLQNSEKIKRYKDFRNEVVNYRLREENIKQNLKNLKCQ